MKKFGPVIFEASVVGNGSIIGYRCIMKGKPTLLGFIIVK